MLAGIRPLFSRVVLIRTKTRSNIEKGENGMVITGTSHFQTLTLYNRISVRTPKGRRHRHWVSPALLGYNLAVSKIRSDMHLHLQMASIRQFFGGSFFGILFFIKDRKIQPGKTNGWHS